MKAFSIVLRNNEISERGYSRLIASSKHVENEFLIERFDAITPAKAYERQYNMRWSYPWIGSEMDLLTGLLKNAYKTPNPLKRIACFLSHYDLWKACSEGDEPYLILEHDAEFIRTLPVSIVNQFDDPYIVGINSPLGATRKAQLFHELVQKGMEIQPVPHVDQVYVPQGLAGNSAYIISPSAAKDVLDKVRMHGAWPNDALLCYQLFPYLRVTRTYYTQVQGLQSTTST